VKSKIARIDKALGKEGVSHESSHHGIDPVDNLILTILSQNTNDTLRDRAFLSLKERYAGHSLIAEAPLAELSETIRIAGLGKQKGKAIKDFLNRIRKEQGAISLDCLRDMSSEAAIAYLMKSKGIGDKTASIVMLFSFGRTTFPVDTHIQRIMKRMGLVPHNLSPPRIRKAVEPCMNGIDPRTLHVRLIEHGKKICRARDPLCGECVLSPLCSFEEKRTRIKP